MTATASAQPLPRKAARINRWDSPWLNPKLLIGSAMVLAVILVGVLGPLLWNTTLARVGSSPLNSAADLRAHQRLRGAADRPSAGHREQWP